MFLRHQRHQEARERDALMSTTFRANDDTTIEVDHALSHHSRLSESHRNVDDLLTSGTHILSNLREQRVSLKGVQKRVLDIANTLGLSNTVLRLIERRTYQDKFILFGGMFLTCVIMFLIWRYFG